MAKKKYYAYKVGKKSGVVDNWPECQEIVAGKEAKYKGFESLEAANAWLEMGADYSVKNVAVQDGIYFDSGTGAGNGVEINVTDKLGNIYVKKNLGHDVTNNFGELMACRTAIDIAMEKNIKKIFGDSKLVIDFWSKWRIKKDVDKETFELAREVSALRKKFEQWGGEIILISGGANPADLGFHRG